VICKRHVTFYICLTWLVRLCQKLVVHVVFISTQLGRNHSLSHAWLFQRAQKHSQCSNLFNLWGPLLLQVFNAEIDSVALNLLAKQCSNFWQKSVEIGIHNSLSSWKSYSKFTNSCVMEDCWLSFIMQTFPKFFKGLSYLLQCMQRF